MPLNQLLAVTLAICPFTGNSELFFLVMVLLSSLTTYSGTFSPSELTASFGNSFGQYCCFINSCHAGIFANNMNNGEISCACENDEYASAVGPDDNCVSVLHFRIKTISSILFQGMLYL